MPGIRNMQIGAAFCIGGAALTVATLAVSGGAFGVAFWGAVLFGGLQFVYGLFQWIIFQIKSPTKKAEHKLKADVRVLLRAMIAVAAADGKLDENEIFIIQVISNSILGEPIDQTTIRSVFSDMRENNFIDEVKSIARETTPDGGRLAVESAILVAISDGDFAPQERAIVGGIADALKLEKDQVQNCLENAHERKAEIIEALNQSGEV